MVFRPALSCKSSRHSWLSFGALLFLSLAGCAPAIGDECQTSADCSQSGERLCDVTQRGGYCTVFNCEPGSCPDDSVCIAFAAEESAVPECQDANNLSRFHRSFCLASCGSDDDCRGGYACVDLGKPDNPWSAIVVDSGSGKVCMEPLRAKPIPEGRPGNVCAPPAASSEAAPTDEVNAPEPEDG